MDRLKFYTVNASYMAYLHELDKIVPHVNEEKARRPFVGIVFVIEGINYFAPLTSYKPKFAKMRSSLDLIIIDKNMGAINLNNMIPVHPRDMENIDINISHCDTADEIKYKTLLENQLEWCNQKKNRDTILKNAAKLYSVITAKNAPYGLKARCCDFKALEKAMVSYCLGKETF